MTATDQATAPGQWITIHCVTVTCSRCGARPDNEDFTPYFDSPQQAREQLARDYGWRTTPRGDGGEELLCEDCAAKDDCARLGHQPESSGPSLMPDGSTLPKMTFCNRCSLLLDREGNIIPAPDGYPVPAPAHRTLGWDAAALPAGHDIADAAWRLMARLSDDAVAARWDAWDGDQAGRPARRAEPDPEADKATAMLLIKAAHGLLCTAVGASHAPAAAVTATPQAAGREEVADAAIRLAALALAFGRIDRTACTHPDGTPESDSDHTVMLGWLAPSLAALTEPGLDPHLVAAYALVHDAVEVHAGDTPTLVITSQGRAEKAARERAARPAGTPTSASHCRGCRR